MPTLNNTLHLALAAILLVASVAVAGDSQMYKGYETPPYTVVQSDGAVEIRDYAPHLLAEVRVEGDRSSAVARGFRRLARFIFGANADDAKVAMTAPVTQRALPASAAPGESPVWDVQFMMPSHFTLGTLPDPNDDAIRFTRTKAERQAVIRFSGLWRSSTIDQKTAALRAWVDAQGLQVAGPPRYYFYDDPFTLPFRRRNEVALPLASMPGA